MRNDTPITVITCWEGQIVDAVMTWLETETHQTAAAIITEGAPEQLLAEGTAGAVQGLRERLAFALAEEEQQTVYLVGHANCLHSALDEARLIPQALARLHEWYPACAFEGMWLDEALHMHAVASLSPE